MLSNYVDDINKSILKLANEIKTDANKRIASAQTDQEKERIKYIAMYYNSVLQGARLFSDSILSSYTFTTDNNTIVLEDNPVLDINISDVSKDIEIPAPAKNMENVSTGNLKVQVSELSEPFEIDENAISKIKLSFAKRRERMAQEAMKNRKKSSSNNVVELNENPHLKTEVEEVYDQEDIILENNPALKTSVSVIYEDDLIIPESFSDNDIILDENPEISVNVEDVYDEGDIILNKNPDLKVDVEEVYDQRDIVLDKNPNLKTEVEEVYNEEDIVLDKNPDLKVDVEEVYDQEDIVFDENPSLKTKVSKVSLDTKNKEKENN